MTMDTRLSNYLLPFLLWMLILPLVQSQLTPDPNCARFTDQRRFCMNIRQCQPLLDQLMQFGKSAGDYLRSTLCGYVDEDPLVCCPIQPIARSLPKTRIALQYPQTAYGPLTAPNCGVNQDNFTRIVNGEPAILGAWPWMAALGYKSPDYSGIEWRCGGSLISTRHVLTAAHCVQGLNLSVVRLGELNLDNENDGASPVDLEIEKATVHPEFNTATHINDVAVLKLARDVVFSDLIRPICLPIYNELRTKNLTGHLPFLAGWGASFYRGLRMSHLQQTQVPIVSLESCQSTFGRQRVIIDNRVVCAGYAKGGMNACTGDSGGPLMFPWDKAYYAVGVVSYSVQCAMPGYPEVFMRVSEYMDFIMQHLN